MCSSLLHPNDRDLRFTHYPCFFVRSSCSDPVFMRTQRCALVLSMLIYCTVKASTIAYLNTKEPNTSIALVYVQYTTYYCSRSTIRLHYILHELFSTVQCTLCTVLVHYTYSITLWFDYYRSSFLTGFERAPEWLSGLFALQYCLPSFYLARQHT